MRPPVGVALTKCYYCLEGSDILINTRLTDAAARNVEKLDGCVLSMEPCPTCKKYMRQGVILIAIDEVRSGKDWHIPPTLNEDRERWMPNPYRTGGFFVVRDEYVRRVFNPPELVDQILKACWSFISDEACRRLGLYEEHERRVTEGEAMPRTAHDRLPGEEAANG